MCTFCKKESESIEHLLLKCEYSDSFWRELINWLNMIEIKIEALSDVNKMFGLWNRQVDFYLLNAKSSLHFGTFWIQCLFVITVVLALFCFSATWRTFYCLQESQTRGVVAARNELIWISVFWQNSPCGKDLKRNILTGKYFPNTTQILKQASFLVSENMIKCKVNASQQHESYCWISEVKSRRGSKENISIE